MTLDPQDGTNAGYDDKEDDDFNFKKDSELTSAEVADLYTHAPDEVIAAHEAEQRLPTIVHEDEPTEGERESRVTAVAVAETPTPRRMFAGIPIATPGHVIPFVNNMIVQVYDELDRQCYNSQDKPDFQTAVIDTGTELQKINMDSVMARTLSAHPDRDPDVPGLHDWGASTNAMRKYLRLYRDLPMNFIFLCHEQTERDNKGVMWKRPDLPGKLTNQAAGLFDQVMYLYTKEGDKGDETRPTEIRRMLLTGALEGYVTKDRSGNLPLVVVEPNMNDIFELIHK